MKNRAWEGVIGVLITVSGLFLATHGYGGTGIVVAGVGLTTIVIAIKEKQ